MVRVLQKRARERTEEKEINPTARTGERCSASQYVNKFESIHRVYRYLYDGTGSGAS